MCRKGGWFFVKEMIRTGPCILFMGALTASWIPKLRASEGLDCSMVIGRGALAVIDDVSAALRNPGTSSSSREDSSASYEQASSASSVQSSSVSSGH